MPYEFKMDRRVAFAETDMAGILHFSNFFRYMEEVEHAFFRSLGLRVHEASAVGSMGWARGEASCRFMRPLTNEDVVELHLLVKEKRAKSIAYEIVILKDGEEMARGNVTAVCVGRIPGEHRLVAVDMPTEVDEQVQVAPPTLFEGA